MKTNLVTLDVLAKYLGVSAKSIYRWTASGRIPSTRCFGGKGRPYLYNKQDVQRALMGKSGTK